MHKATKSFFAATLALTGMVFSAGTASASQYVAPVFFIDAGNRLSLNPDVLVDWHDLTGYHGDTETMGGVSFNSRDKSIDFDGSGGFYIAPSGFADFSNGISIISEANFGRRVDSWERIIDFGNGFEDDNIILTRAWTTDDLIFEVWVDGNRVGRATTVNSPLKRGKNKFHTILATLNDRMVPKIYVDGARQRLEISYSDSPKRFFSMPAVVTRTSNLIGKSHWEGIGEDQPFEGAIRSIKIYDRALSYKHIKKMGFIQPPG